LYDEPFFDKLCKFDWICLHVTDVNQISDLITIQSAVLEMNHVGVQIHCTH